MRIVLCALLGRKFYQTINQPLVKIKSSARLFKCLNKKKQVF